MDSNNFATNFTIHPPWGNYQWSKKMDKSWIYATTAI